MAKTSVTFQTLMRQAQQAKITPLRDLFAEDKTRFSRFSAEGGGIFLDYSKNHLTQDTLDALLALAEEVNLSRAREDMFLGKKINTTEGRAALHTALRNPEGPKIMADGLDARGEIQKVLEKMRLFSRDVREKKYLGTAGNPISHVVNIGIGGSDLGPRLLCEALAPPREKQIQADFLANADGSTLQALFSRARPSATLFIVSSKSFSTAETLANANACRAWLSQNGISDISRHFAAVTAAPEKARAFGIADALIFPFWDWVGGRFSLWGPISLAAAIVLGMEAFLAFLAGGREMDKHFLETPFSKNLPVLLALTAFWNRIFLGRTSRALVPYGDGLSLLVPYVQQLEMESNGKAISADGAALPYHTQEVLWGGVGTPAQHAFFQLLHQGSDIIPVDFVLAARARHPHEALHHLLLANGLAQAEALMRGRKESEAKEAMEKSGLSQQEIQKLLPHKIFPGNRPSNTILLPEISPEALGALLALYEHKVFVEGTLWGVNSFDQWGVELGKELATGLVEALSGKKVPPGRDASTSGLLERIFQEQQGAR